MSAHPAELSWSTALVLVAAIVSATILGATGVLPGEAVVAVVAGAIPTGAGLASRRPRGHAGSS